MVFHTILSYQATLGSRRDTQGQVQIRLGSDLNILCCCIKGSNCNPTVLAVCEKALDVLLDVFVFVYCAVFGAYTLSAFVFTVLTTVFTVLYLQRTRSVLEQLSPFVEASCQCASGQVGKWASLWGHFLQTHNKDTTTADHDEDHNKDTTTDHDEDNNKDTADHDEDHNKDTTTDHDEDNNKDTADHDEDHNKDTADHDIDVADDDDDDDDDIGEDEKIIPPLRGGPSVLT